MPEYTHDVDDSMATVLLGHCRDCAYFDVPLADDPDSGWCSVRSWTEPLDRTADNWCGEFRPREMAIWYEPEEEAAP